mgnify:CR=1 FL=1
MVNLLAQHSDLLSLLLKAELNQKKAILSTLDLNQTDFIGEIIYNFLNTFPIGESELKKLSRKPWLKKISNFQISPRHRRTLIKKNKKVIIDLLTKHKDPLLSLL